jgi:centromere/kinetochore protein ZW10
LVETEIAFNQAVMRTLEEVQRLCQRLEAGRAMLVEGQVMGAIETLEAAEQAIKEDNLFTNTNVMHVLLENVGELRRDIVESLRARWSELLIVDRKGSRFTLSDDNGKRPPLSLTMAVMLINFRALTGGDYCSIGLSQRARIVQR